MSESNPAHFRPKGLRRPDEQYDRNDEVAQSAFQPKVLRLLGSECSADDPTVPLGEHMLVEDTILPPASAMKIKTRRESHNRSEFDPLINILHVSPVFQGVEEVSPDALTRLMATSMYSKHFGIRLTTVSQEQCSALGLNVSIAFFVLGTDPDGPAAHGGVIAGDYLLAINGCHINDMQALANTLITYPTHRLISMRVLRSGDLLDLEWIFVAQ